MASLIFDLKKSEIAFFEILRFHYAGDHVHYIHKLIFTRSSGLVAPVVNFEDSYKDKNVKVIRRVQILILVGTD